MDGHFAFHLSAEEHRRILKFFRGATWASQPWAHASVTTLYAFAFISSVFRHRLELALMNFVFAVFWGVFWLRSTKPGRLAVEGDLRLASTGFVGTLDKEPAQIDWADIIPKSNIDDIAGLWAELEDRLVSKRGLVRSAAPRSRILNSAY